MPSAHASKVHFFFKRPIRLSDRNALKTFIENAFSKKRIRLNNLNFIFCSDRELRNINKQYLGHDYFTDIITFDLEGNRGVEGEIFISVERARVNARDFDVSLKLELHRLIFHGILHLFGHEDLTAGDKREMTRLENKLLDAYFK